MRIDHSVDDLVLFLASSCDQFEICEALIESEAINRKLISSRESLFLLLSAIQRIIDSARPALEGGVDCILDVTRSQALCTYTSLVIAFDDLCESIRPQFLKALTEMIFRRHQKRRDYVNSFLRASACECLLELELAFPGEVTEALGITEWLMHSHGTYQPSIIDVLQDENLPCVENYAKLLLTCSLCPNNSLIMEKSLIKVVSLLLDSVEFSSPWLRGYIATTLSSLVRKSAGQAENLWTLAVVQHHFGRLLSSSSVYQLHAYLQVCREFVGEWDPYLVDRVVDKLYSIVNSGHRVALPVRQTVSLWLCELLGDYFMKFSVYERRHQLLPQAQRDPPELIEVKLQAILRYSLAFRSIPKNVLNCLTHRANLDVNYRFIVRLLNQFFERSNDPDLFGVPNFLKDDLQLSGSVSPSVISAVQNASHGRCRMKLLTSLAEYLINVQPPTRILVNYFSLLAFLASQSDLGPTCIISSLERYKSAFCSGENPSWREGLQFVEVCRILILTHNDSVDLVVGLLKSASAKWPSLDVRERASSLIRFVSTLDKENDRRTFLIPKKFISSKLLQEPNLVEEVEPGQEVPPKFSFTRNMVLRENLGIQDGGWAIFDFSNEGDQKLVLPFTLVFDEDGDNPPSSIEELYAIELTFSVSDSYHAFKSVTIPFLKKAPDGSIASGFPYKYDVSLFLRAIHPVPTNFSVQALFTDKQGRSHTAELESFRISLEDLFLPSRLEDTVSVWKEKWVQPYAKLLTMNRDVVRESINKRLGPFALPADVLAQLPQPPNDFDFEHELLLFEGTAENLSDGNPLFEEAAVMIHLPPSYHLMMRFQMGLHTTVVWLATDRNEVLDLLDVFFQQWMCDNV